MEDTLQDAFKSQSSLLPWRKAVKQLCIMSYKMTVHMILSCPPWLLSLCHATTPPPPHKPYKRDTWLIDLLWKWLNNLVVTATLALEYLFYILIFNGGKLLVIILFLLLSVTWMGHTVKGGWGCVVPSLSQLPGGPVPHNAIFCSPPVSQPGEMIQNVRVWLG